MSLTRILPLSIVIIFLFFKIPAYAQSNTIKLSPYKSDYNKLSVTLSIDTLQPACDLRFKLSIANNTDSSCAFVFCPAYIRMRIFNTQGLDMTPIYGCGMIRQLDSVDFYHYIFFDSGKITANGKSSDIDFEEKLNMTLHPGASCDLDLKISKIYRYNWDSLELGPGVYYFSVLVYIENRPHLRLFAMPPVRISYGLGNWGL